MSDIKRPYQPVVPSFSEFSQENKLLDLETAVNSLVSIIKSHTPSGRLQAVALTQLELASMAAYKAITHASV